MGLNPIPNLTKVPPPRLTRSKKANLDKSGVKYTARGFRNKQNFVNAIYFHCGGLNLAP